MQYHPQVIEKKWQKIWAEKKIFKTTEDSSKPKYYLLEMLPYPSGRIHMGHVRNYTIGDVFCRFLKMQGFNVLHPMGWDAFGMPAENAAIQKNVPPVQWTYENIDAMRVQLQRLGYSYDWDREFATCDPDYYRWEQLIFLKMFEKGLVFRKSSNVNWCERCQTVLANEQVDKGCCWRCDNIVIQKLLEQWYFKLPAYADELLKDIDDKLQGWPERIKTMQREWIGKSEGTSITFKPVTFTGVELADSLTVFTTRPDTLFGVTFLSLACEHPLLLKLAEEGGKKKEIEKFIAKTAKIDRMKRLLGDYEKEGVFTGSYCLHPITHEKIPIYAANFVLMDYGTGAVMAVPAHDQRDFEFAKKYQLLMKVVIEPFGKKLDPQWMKEAYEGEGVLVNSSSFSGIPNLKAILSITKALQKQGAGEPTVHFKLKDWCLSRQRYWGTPIPIIYCDLCGVVPVPEKDLPVILPKDVQITGEGGSPLARHEKFVNTKCPKCKKKARRETDTMDTFVESSWYFLRYTSPHYNEGPFDSKAVSYWMPIDQYIGGVEHAVGHLIYCRFFTKVLRDLGFTSLNEPVKNLMTQGMVIKEGFKMSKSKGNVVDPDEMIEKYGADAVRLFILFAAPVEKDLDWNEQGLEGMYRFLGRVWRLVGESSAVSSQLAPSKIEGPSTKNKGWRHKTIKRVTEDIKQFHFNTALAALMEYLNFLQSDDSRLTTDDFQTLVLLLSPFAPHIAEEFWEKLGHKESCLFEAWPTWDEKQLQSSLMSIVVQVNGKLRGTFEIDVNAPEDRIKETALALERVQNAINGKKILKKIYVPKKLVNFVIQ